MKYKNKLLGILASSILAASSLAAAVGCSCSSKPSPEPEVQPWDIGVTFKGSSQTIAVNSESPENIVFDNFELSTTLAFGETMSVELIKSSSSNVELVYFPDMPQTKFEIDVKLKTKPTVYTEYKFGLIFRFYVNGVEKATKLIDNFCIEYTASWLHNSIHWKTKAGDIPYNKEFNLSEGKSIYYSDYFYLDHPLETPREKLEIDSIYYPEASQPHDVIATIDQVDGTKVKVLFKLEDPADGDYSDRAFTVNFKFTYNDEQQGNLIPIDGFIIKPKKPYVAPTIELTGTGTGDLILETTQGTTGYHIDSEDRATDNPDRYFLLKDSSGNITELGADDEIRVVDNKANIDTFCFINDVPTTTDPVRATYVDLVCSFNDVYDPYVLDKSETFKITFQFYHLGELVSEQAIDTNITLKYTPLPGAETVLSKTLGIVFEPAEIDTDGDFNIDFVGKIGKKDSQSWEESALHKGEYLTMINDSYGQKKSEEKLWNYWEITKPAVKYELDEQGLYDIQKEPIEAIEGTEEGLSEVTFSVHDFLECRAGTTEQGRKVATEVFNNMTQLTTKFYNKDPIAHPDASPISTVNNNVDFIHYPAGFWEADSAAATDAWIADRTFAILCSYQTTPGDESTRVTSFGNAWVLNHVSEPMNLNSFTKYDYTMVTSRDFYQKIKPVLNMPTAESIAHDVRFGISNKVFAKKYVGAGSTNYITPKDFIYLAPIADEPNSSNESNSKNTLRVYRDEDQSDFVWTKDPLLSDGSDVAVFSLCVGAAVTAEAAEIYPWAAEVAERNEELMHIAARDFVVIEDWIKDGAHDGQITNLEPGNCIDNWDNWACALCSGFTGTTIKVDGVDTPALYWMSHEIKFDYGHLPEYCSIEQSKAQEFPNLGKINDRVINHASSAYKLPDAYSKGNDPENIWFSDEGSGSMFVVREWQEGAYGQKLDIPRVAGINWNGGNTVAGVDSFNPWIDLFYDNSTNMLDKYMVPIDPNSFNLPWNFLGC